MKAVGFQKPLPSSDPEALCDIDLPMPRATGRDLLVKVKAVSVNPVDVKVRRRTEAAAGSWKVLGYDAAGIVVEAGEGTSLFKPGDEVFYAGDLLRAGTNSEFHLVDERIVGPKPIRLTWAEAAALPLTSITAWEAIFDRLQVDEVAVSGAAHTLLLVGGAGGVGSIAIQLARKLTDLTVVATASRAETVDWCLTMDAHHVIDHRDRLDERFAALDLGEPAFAFCTTNSSDHLPRLARLMAPQGRLAIIEDSGGLNVSFLKEKSIALHWEYMFTRSMFATADIQAQHEILTIISKLMDAGTLLPTVGQHFGPINAANLRRAHACLESGRTRGKIVLEEFVASN